MIIRVFYNSDFTVNSFITLTADEHKYLKVLRLDRNEIIEVFGKTNYAIAKILNISKDSTTLQILEIKSYAKPEIELLLFQALPEFKKAELIVQKTVELGINEIYFFETERSEKIKTNTQKLAKLQKIAIEAIRQCKRYSLVKICFLTQTELKNILNDFYIINNNTNSSKKQSSIFCLSPDANSIFENKLLTSVKQLSKIAFIIGPESGFSETDKKFFENFNVNFIKINQNILRAETAAIAVTTLFALTNLK